MLIPIFSGQHAFEKLQAKENHFFSEYYAFYSSWLGGIVTDPTMMLIPIDDHMVHRGDGVFECMKAVDRSVYLMEEHLQRLFISAERIGLISPFSMARLREIILETLRTAAQDNACIRVFLSRGPGDFTANPYDPIEAQIYIIISQLKPPANVKYQQGLVIGQSSVEVKSAWMAQVKSCNYLPNVLMKKEAVDRGIDFVIGIDSQGNITESATENIIIVDESGTIVYPILDNILKGTTMLRACELARECGIATEMRAISIEDLIHAREVMITGTTLNILPVVKFENHTIGHGYPGEVAKKLQSLMLADIKMGCCGVSF